MTMQTESFNLCCWIGAGFGGRGLLDEYRDAIVCEAASNIYRYIIVEPSVSYYTSE